MNNNNNNNNNVNDNSTNYDEKQNNIHTRITTLN